MKNGILVAAAVLVLGITFLAARSFLSTHPDEITASGEPAASTDSSRARRSLVPPTAGSGEADAIENPPGSGPEDGRTSTGSVTGRLLVERSNGPAGRGLKVSLAIAGGSLVEAVSDESGRFALAALPAFPGAVLTVSGGGLGLLPRRVEDLAPGEHRELGDLVVNACSSIQGRVTGAGGTGVPGASVELYVNRAFRSFADFDFIEVIHAVYSEEPPGLVTKADANGDFGFSGVPLGEYIARAVAPGLAQAYSPPIILKQGTAQPRVLIRMTAGIVVQGKVVDSSGVGIGNAMIAAVASGDEMPTTFRSRKTRSDADGSFRFEGMGKTRHAILVRASGYAEGGSSETNDKNEPITIVLQRGARSEGKVFDVKSGLPLAGVKVYAVNMGGQNTGLVETESDAGGHYLLDGVHPEGRITLLARLDGYALVRPPKERDASFDFLHGIVVSESERSGGNFVRDIGMTPCGSLAGRVLRLGSNQPLAGVRIELKSTDQFGASERSARPEPLTTDADGRFVFQGVRAGSYFLSAVHDECVLVVPAVEPAPTGTEESEEQIFFGKMMTPPGVTRIKMPEQGDLSDLTLLMEDGFSVEGVVVDEFGRPVTGAEVTWGGGQMRGFFLGAMPVENPRVPSDGEGRFRLKGLPRNTEILVQARHRDHPFGEIERVTTSNSGAPLRLVLHRGGRVEVNVTNPDGTPAAEVAFLLRESRPREEQLVVFTEDLMPILTGRRTRSSGEGRLVFEDLPPGEWMLDLDWSERSKKRLPGGSLKLTCRPGETTTLELHLAATTQLTGIAVDAAGTPMSGVVVRALREPDADSGEVEFDNESGITDGSGRFTLEGLTTGVNYIVTAFKELPEDDAEEPVVSSETSDDVLQSESTRTRIGLTSDPLNVKAGSSGDLRIVLKPVEEAK